MGQKELMDNALPLVVAVTGHRDLVIEELQAIESLVQEFFADLQTRYPHNRLVVMSPLAEGADLLVAKIAVTKDVPLLVPLPKPRDEYLQDFRHEESRLEFEDLCGKATAVFEIANGKPPAPEGIDPSRWEADYPYAQLGTFLSAHCHILLALWDGNNSKHLGGTGQVVKFHHDDVMPGITPKTLATQRMLVDDESDLVYHIVCSRADQGHQPHPEHEPLSAFWYTKDEQNPQSERLPGQHEMIFQRYSEFSEDARVHRDEIKSANNSLLPAEQHHELPAGIEDIDALYRAADWLAIFYQKRTLRTLTITHVMAFLMGFMFILYSDFESYRSLLIAFLCFFGVAALVQIVSKRGAWHRKYLDYRTLAEGLRVQFYWAAAGVTNESKWKFAHDSYLQSQNPEFGWIRNVMRVSGIRCDADPNSSQAGIDFAAEQWVGQQDSGQLGYFKHKASDRIRRNRLTESLALLSLYVSVATVLIFVLFAQRMGETWQTGLTVVMGSALLLYAVREGYAYATATRELIKQYEYMLRIFDNAHRRLGSAQDAEEKRQILSALGQSALDEHSDWILMHRERSLDESEIWRMGS